jgi:hypothetical protein
MPILYIRNDPEAKKGVAAGPVTPARKRAKGKTDFNFGKLPEAKVYPLASDGFLVWQCREGLQRALAMWEGIAGRFGTWRDAGKKLKVLIDAGADINAYYGRGELGFYSDLSKKGKVRRFAFSVDVVSHEAGHAFLDVIRPDLFDTPYLETNAFHEAFGDCIAILTSLDDPEVRAALLKQDPKLSKTNFVETLMESLANASKDDSPRENGAVARRGKNKYRWMLPTELPDDGGPGVLINEDHSFGQVFVGCFYDTLRNVFLAQKKKDSAALAKSAEIVGKLLVRGADKAPITPRFFQAVGRAMSLEDDALYKRAHHEAIRLAFQAHGILLGAVVAVAPRAALKGAAPKRVKHRGKPVLAKATLEDLRSRMNLPPRTTMSVRAYELGGTPVAEASHLRAVSLRGLSERLANVVALGSEPTLVGASKRRAAVMGALPDAQMTSDEVRTFVSGLVHRGAIAYNAKQAATARAGKRRAVRTKGTVTHVVITRKGQKVLERLRFSCGCANARGRDE